MKHYANLHACVVMRNKRKMADEGDRDIILANFQSITGIDNLTECITLLEHHDWDLTTCVNSVLGADDVDSPIRPSSPPQEVQVIGQTIPLHHPPRRVKFLIEWKEKTLTVILGDHETVGTIKRMIEMQNGVPPDHQSLMGWAHNQTLNDETVLKDLNLREETALVLLTPTITETPKQSTPCAVSSALNGEAGSSGIGSPNVIEKVMLNIKYHTDEYNLPYPMTKTVGEVKSDVHSLTSIPCRNQHWSGWPDGTTDSLTLHEAKLSFPVHVLTVTKRENNEGSSKSTSIDVDMEQDDGSDEDESNLHIIDEDEDDDDMFADVPCRRQFTELLPQDSIDSSENLIKFAANFEGRYGDSHPHFYMGPLSEAIKEANGKSAKHRRPLLVYLHHDGSILANVFCGQLLCSETITNYIDSNFVIWAWDVSHDTNRARLLDMITTHFGSIAASTVRGFQTEKYPLILAVMKNRSALEVCSVLQGQLSLDELMTGLMSAYETFQQAMIQEIKDEEERELREMMRKEQDIAYEESLKEDRRKEEEKRKKQEEEIIAKKLQEEQALHEAQLKEAQRLSLVDQLADEPGPDCTEPISDLRFWLPNGQRLQRRFLASSHLQNVLTYVQTQGFLENDYKVVTNFPRRDLYTLDRTKSLQAHGIYPQEKIIVEER
ncbi:FAS-associated factor 1 [Exaiptasia diaphana]|uniref:FAS-associated factor 1 n=1 Tax=Exaiptasia diaphana TaxID=2652724 RepID=A0A913WZ04_EXADI|nr:FAS-associated factor 1 [Exaiptasia diaphana]